MKAYAKAHNIEYTRDEVEAMYPYLTAGNATEYLEEHLMKPCLELHMLCGRDAAMSAARDARQLLLKNKKRKAEGLPPVEKRPEPPMGPIGKQVQAAVAANRKAWAERCAQSSESEQEYTHPEPKDDLLGPQPASCRGKKTLILDLDETLIMRTRKVIKDPLCIVPADFGKGPFNYYVQKRPHVDLFLEQMAPLWEIVVWSAGRQDLADPMIDALDPKGYITKRLFRNDCTFLRSHGLFIKDMGRIGRAKKDAVIIDNDDRAYIWNRDQGIPVESWFGATDDT